jgi:hypothetical protein
MVYGNFGDACKITAYCGKHQVKGYPHPVMLVKVRYDDDGDERYLFPLHMRADGGIKEIDTAVDAAPEVTLEAKELRAAIQQAM